MSKPYPCDYPWVESIVESYAAQWRRCGFDAVVSIARGGLVPGVMASTLLSLPLYALSYQRPTRSVQWFSREAPQTGARVLLVEDIAGRGTTLVDCLEFLRRSGFDTEVFTLAWDESSRIEPSYGCKMPAGWRAWFPWERESITDAFAATANLPSRPEYEYASWAMDLDGILLPDIAETHYLRDLQAALRQRDGLLPNAVLPGALLPGGDVSDLPIITGRPEQDRNRTQAWLDRHGFGGKLIMRDESRYTAEQTAQHKAQMIMDQRYTHFIESEAAQAIKIASIAKLARVFWWDGSQALTVYAHL